MSDTNIRVLAADLLTEPQDSNPEYDRALCELVADFEGLSMDDVPAVLADLRERQANR